MVTETRNATSPFVPSPSAPSESFERRSTELATEIRIQIWDGDEIDRWIHALDRSASIAERPLRQAALELAWGLRHAGRALAYVDEEDGDVVFDLLTRLDALRADAERVIERIEASSLSAGEDEITRVWRRSSPDLQTTDEITHVRSRVVRRRSGLAW
jgi:hypothetical protein